VVSSGDLDQVFLARHGQTEWNRAGRVQGRLDSPLTERGEQQARRLARTIARFPGIDAVFSSPLGRAMGTATFYAEALGTHVTVIEDLTEVDHGEWGGLTRPEIKARFPGMNERRQQDKYHWRFPGGESYADADVRAARVLAAIAGRGARCPVIVSHQMLGRMLMRRLLGVDPATALGWSQPNDVVYQIDPRRRTRTAVRHPEPRRGWCS
jgi:probable phosphoglycerate mutase